MVPRMNKQLIPLLALLVAACSFDTVPWAKATATPEQTSTDYSACRAQARASVNEALGRDAERIDMFSNPPSLFSQSTNIIQDTQREQLRAQARKREDAETGACMRGRGYSAK